MGKYKNIYMCIFAGFISPQAFTTILTENLDSDRSILQVLGTEQNASEVVSLSLALPTESWSRSFAAQKDSGAKNPSATNTQEPPRNTQEGLQPVCSMHACSRDKHRNYQQQACQEPVQQISAGKEVTEFCHSKISKSALGSVLFFAYTDL